MALRDDVNRGLRALSRDPAAPLALDGKGECEIDVEIPGAVAELAGQKLTILARMARSGRFFTLLAPIALAKMDIPAAVVNQLFADQRMAEYVVGTSFALERETGVVFAVYHWVLGAISPEQFVELFEHFAAATFTLLERIGVVAAGQEGMSTIKDVPIR